MLKLQDLMYFKKLADLKSFTKTSNFFNVSQPTISYAIKRIEEEFNIEVIYLIRTLLKQLFIKVQIN